MKIKVVKEIDCCVACPFFIKEPNGSPYCSHPSIVVMELSYNIVDNPVCGSGFPEGCPLLKGKLLKEYNKEKKSKAVLKSKLVKLWKTK